MPWNLSDARPIYVQLADRLRRRIVSGQYPPGYKLPSVREFASEAAVNPNTMQRSFASLEADGLVTTEGTAGRFVTGEVTVIEAHKTRLARDAVFEFADAMRAIGIPDEALCGQIELAIKPQGEGEPV